MPELPYMPFYINDYLGDTQNLTTEQHGAYLLLIFHYWNCGSLVDDDEELASIVRLSNERWLSVRTKIERMFKREGNRWVHERIEKELAKARKLISQKREAGKSSATSRAAAKSLNKRSNETPTSFATDVQTSVQTSVDIRASGSGSKILDLSSEVLNTSQVGNSFSRADAKTDALVIEKKCEKAITLASGRFSDWWAAWSIVRGTAYRQEAVQAWLSAVPNELGDEAMHCLASYLASLDGSGKGFNPHTWIFQQARDQFKARWPAYRKNGRAEEQKSAARQKFLDRMAKEKGMPNA